MKMRIYHSVVIFSILAPLCILAVDSDPMHRIHNHWLLRDYDSILEEAQSLQHTTPQLYELAVQQVMALSCLGRESEALVKFKHLVDEHPKAFQNRNLLEILSWGIIQKSQHSPLLQVNLYALLGASMTHDAKAIPFLLSSLRSSSTLMRSIAVKLACSYADDPLKQQLQYMLMHERDWYVRLEVIKACGLLKMQNSMGNLVDIVSDPKSTKEERSCALIALVHICDHLNMQEIQAMATSTSSGLRALACDLILEFDMKEASSALVLLLADTSPLVRLRSLNSLVGIQIKNWGEKSVNDTVASMLGDSSPEVSITAAWCLAAIDDPRGDDALKNWLQQKEPSLQRLAASAVAALGSKGLKLCRTFLDSDIDKFARANLALGLLYQKELIPKAASILFSLLDDNDCQWIMWESGPSSSFKGLAPSKVRHIENIPNYPAFVDRQVRLEIFSWLAALGEGKAKEQIKKFLKENSYAATMLAAESLLDIGDEGSYDLIRELLTDADPAVSFEAAILLAFNGGDEEAIKKLKELYASLDREKKLFVLETLGVVGGEQAIPFLVQALQDSFQLVRVVAASSLIRCLYS